MRRPVIVVVGSVNVDLVVRAGRLPRAGETVLGGDLERHGGGKGANAAVAAARLGAEVRLVAAVGEDDLGAAPFAPMLTPNATEAVALTALSDPCAAAERLARRMRAPVALTLGADGAVLAEPGASAVRLPAVAVGDVIDTTGAGDTFNGALAVALARGEAKLGAVGYAMIAAAHTVGARGARTGMPRAEQLG